MKKPIVHLICNAHLDPVWQWRWEEGAAEAITTFGIAARLLKEFPGFIFNHNEAILYRWVEEHNPGLFDEIRDLVAEGRWCVAGGWDLQPDVNMPGTEAIIRHAAEGRRYFSERFGVHPVVAYNFDSFGHSGGLPQILVKAGYKMYIHMRPGQKDLPLPSDLYRWQGVDGSEIAVYRIPFPAYNTFHNKAVERIRAAIELALKDGRDTPVFWGLGDHGGGATRKELEQIQNLIECERQVEVVHSSTERFYEAVRPIIAEQPVVTGELQRVFTGCYTSMSRLKRRMQRNLGELVQTEGARAATWWLHGQPYPASELRDAWADHLFNDFHDILSGSSIEPGELDALDLYGRSSETTRRLRIGAVSGFSRGTALPLEIPVTILNTNPAALAVPVEFEYMIDHVPKFEGVWHARMFTLDGKEVPIQEEPPESLLLTDSWRRKLVFGALLPGVGSAHYRIEMHQGPREAARMPASVDHSLDRTSGLLASLKTPSGAEILAGNALVPLVVEDLADSWGMEEWSYRKVLGAFSIVPGSFRIVEDGKVRRITEATFEFDKSAINCRTITYAAFPFLELRLRVQWNEWRKRLKLSIPTVFGDPDFVCEIPGGAMIRPADGQEYVQGRWMIMHGDVSGSQQALAIVNSGQYGVDVKDGEARISLLRSPLYCHEHTFPLEQAGRQTVMDQGVHEMRLLLMVGEPGVLRKSITGLADWMSAPPVVLPHFPIGDKTPASEQLLSIAPQSVRLTACKQSWDENALILRLHETKGERGAGAIHMTHPAVSIELMFEPFEIKTIRLEREGTWREVEMIEEGG
jgi:alpha-mannosidase